MPWAFWSLLCAALPGEVATCPEALIGSLGRSLGRVLPCFPGSSVRLSLSG